MEKPTFICIPSLSHSPFIFDRLKTALQSHGYPMIPLALPSIGGRPPTYDFTEDVRAIRSLASQLVEAGKELIIVMHGYAGIPGGEALLGLGKPEREMAGLQGGVTRLVFIMAWLCKEGFQGSPRGDITDMYPWVTCNLETGILTINPAQATSVFYNDMQRHEAEYWASQLLPQSIGVFWSKTTYAAWRFIPSTYVICGRDQMFTPAYGHLIISAARASGRCMLDTIERCDDAGHCVMLSQVQWTVDMLRRAAGERCE